MMSPRPSSMLILATAVALSSSNVSNAFLAPTPHAARYQQLSSSVVKPSTTQLHVSGSPDAPKTIEEDAALQWDMFTRHHALDGEWWGSWSTYNYMGDLEDSTVAGVSLQPNEDSNIVAHTHRILSSSTESDCQTCFSSSQVDTLPIAMYTPETLGRRHRCATVGMVVGPSVLKSGAMSTELVLRHGDGRVRVTFQHAPVWERGIEPGSCPPQGLKLFRAVVSKEKLRPTAEDGTEGTIQGPPSADEEKSSPPAPGNPRFFRPVPPFNWHAKWAGTSWTWGPQTGDRGWSIQEMDDADSWHGRPTGDAEGTWSLRLPGGVLIQCPRVIVGGMSGICRLAWMPEDDGEVGTEADGNKAKLLRIEASVMALEPIISDNDDEMMVGFHPPSLGSLRTDLLEKEGELEGASLEERAQAAEGYVWGSSPGGDADEGSVAEKSSAMSNEAVAPKMEEGSKAEKKSPTPEDEDLKKKIAADPRNALDF
eukprot:CAMPEP_0172317860 /NCGR_PEP_ID=MMETSP1058-20130122/33076_1 /TAXON_ID=83371 /ORGANISM="Detonula confervacea, Strain CCMP 353" /LENGTH=480 /DNA_ID=CAMNT_0013032537 /DNA_START=1 /DNA_END=1443 /DNA_ORIENTATION=+